VNGRVIVMNGSGSLIAIVIVILRESGYGKKKRDCPSRLLEESLVHM
jgi:hypothetical protein